MKFPSTSVLPAFYAHLEGGTLAEAWLGAALLRSRGLTLLCQITSIWSSLVEHRELLEVVFPKATSSLFNPTGGASRRVADHINTGSVWTLISIKS